MVHTVWDKFIDNVTAYFGLDAEGARHFPSVSVEAAQFLARGRRLSGMGIDTASLDVADPFLCAGQRGVRYSGSYEDYRGQWGTYACICVPAGRPLLRQRTLTLSSLAFLDNKVKVKSAAHDGHITS
ncbi:hypothetical protein V5799_026235 [Amblyomma americanum]|uniref:Uncharacterized protein n=1 Tax=Amblyomma americanum TaxID=6943 RepID=A0AAQ4DJ56_AMBAM